MKRLIIITSGSLILLSSCVNNKIRSTNVENGCELINSLAMERYVYKTGNYFANQIIPIIEQDSHIQASCQKGTFGYIYKSDSVFNADVMKWREYYECKFYISK